MRALFVNEIQNFQREKDPMEAMEIGIFSPRDFKAVEKAVNFIIEFLPAIIGKKEIPEDFLMGTLNHSSHKDHYPYGFWNPGNGINRDFPKIRFYINKYITINRMEFQYYKDSYKLLFLKLAKMGYKTPVSYTYYPIFFNIET